LILDTGTLSPDKKLAAYSVGCYMRNIISALYDTIPVSWPLIPVSWPLIPVAAEIGHDRPEWVVTMDRNDRSR